MYDLWVAFLCLLEFKPQLHTHICHIRLVDALIRAGDMVAVEIFCEPCFAYYHCCLANVYSAKYGAAHAFAIEHCGRKAIEQASLVGV